MSLFLKQAKYKNGKIFLSIVDGYRVNNKVKQVVIKKLGYLSDLEKQFDDPIAYFKEEVTKMKNENKNNFDVPSSISKNELLTNEDSVFNVGYVFLKRIYEEIGLPDFFKKKQTSLDINYNLNKIFSLLVFSRILYPGSKKDTYENRNKFFEPFNNFSLDDIYRALSRFVDYKEEIELLLWNNTKDIYKRDTTNTYYDCTNYYFEIDYNDEDILDEEGNIIEKGYRKRGPEKNHRPDPIVELGLLMDSNDIPLAYNIFPGNESEKLSLLPLFKNTKAKFNLNRTIIIADRGLNTSDNIFNLASTNDGTKPHMDGYIYGQSVRGADQEFKDWVLNQDDYISEPSLDENGKQQTFRRAVFNDKNEITDYVKEPIYFKHKSRIYPKTLEVNVVCKKSGKTIKKKVKTDQKQMVYYSQKYADKQKRDRNKMIAKARDLIDNPHKYKKATSYGATNYINNLQFNPKTGEVLENLNLMLNEEKIKEEEKYDGYYSIVTSEITMSDFELRKKYRGLSKIEESFKITKTTLETRPVYVWTKDHIEAHFLTCFVSLVILRLLEQKNNNFCSINKIIENIKDFNCINEFSNIFLFFKTSEVIKELEKNFNIDFSKKRLTRNEIRKILNY